MTMEKLRLPRLHDVDNGNSRWNTAETIAFARLNTIPSNGLYESVSCVKGKEVEVGNPQRITATSTFFAYTGEHEAFPKEIVLRASDTEIVKVNIPQNALGYEDLLIIGDLKSGVNITLNGWVLMDSKLVNLTTIDFELDGYRRYKIKAPAQDNRQRLDGNIRIKCSADIDTGDPSPLSMGYPERVLVKRRLLHAGLQSRELFLDPGSDTEQVYLRMDMSPNELILVAKLVGPNENGSGNIVIPSELDAFVRLTNEIYDKLSDSVDWRLLRPFVRLYDMLLRSRQEGVIGRMYHIDSQIKGAPREDMEIPLTSRFRELLFSFGISLEVLEMQVGEKILEPMRYFYRRVLNEG